LNSELANGGDQGQTRRPGFHVEYRADK
jgi:hypothetical protein